MKKPNYSLHTCIWRLEQRLLKLKKRGRMIGLINYMFNESIESEKEADEIETALVYLREYYILVNKTDSKL